MFGGLTEEELKRVHTLLDEKHYAKNDYILKQGESNNSVFFILEGSVSVLKHSLDPKGGDREITILHTGDSFGEMELIDIQSCAASVIALTDTKVITLSNKDLYTLSKNHLMTYTMIIMNLAREISRRLRATDNLLALVTTRQGKKSSKKN
jgi:CRP-like cAMP-binding protein